MMELTGITDAMRSDLSANRETTVSGNLVSAGRGFQSTLNNTLETMERRDLNESDQQRLMNVCIEMESMFVVRMLREMRNSVPKNEWLHGGFAEDVFSDMLYDEYALQISKNSNLGLARQLYDEMSRNV